MALSVNLTQQEDKSDLVAYWSVPLCDRVHVIEFEHGSTSGKRVLRVDGKEILRRDWMFRLVGDEKFALGPQKTKCELRVDPMPHFTFSYSLYVDGKPLEKFIEKQNRSSRSWAVISNGKQYRVVFEKQSLNVWVNGEQVETEDGFVTSGSEMQFYLDDCEATIRSSSDNKNAIVHNLYVNNKRIEEDSELPHWKK